MKECFTIGISTRALFDLEKEHKIFEESGAEEYVAYQIAHQEEVLATGAAFPLIRSLLALNTKENHQIEVVIMSKNSAEVSLRIFHSIEHYGLDITRAALTTGGSIAPYLQAFDVDLYLSYNEEDVRLALASGVAAGRLLPRTIVPFADKQEIRIAFDGDAVLFSDEAEQVFMEEGKEAFCLSEKKKAREPLSPGPFAHVLQMLSRLQGNIRIALVTARSAPAHERVIRTLQSWGVRMDEAFFLGGMDKSQVLEAFGTDIFFDDNEENTKRASRVVLAARVPIVGRSA